MLRSFLQKESRSFISLSFACAQFRPDDAPEYCRVGRTQNQKNVSW